MDNAYQAVLDREGAVKTVAHFKDAIDLLNELLDYGTNLVPRAYASSPKDLKAICVLFVQLRQFLEHLDGVAVLVAAGAPGTAVLQLRSLIETSHAMEWLLKGDTEVKVNHLYVSNLRQRRHWQSAVIPGAPEAARHAATVAAIPLTSDHLKEITEEVNRIDAILGQPNFSAINAKFEPHYQARNFDEPWYKVYGIASIRKIAEELGKMREYTYLYSPFSGITHGSDMWKNIAIGDKNIAVNPLRQVQNIPQMVSLSVSLSLHVYRLVLQEYRPGEEENFDRKYITDWRERFFRKYEIELTPKEIVI